MLDKYKNFLETNNTVVFSTSGLDNQPRSIFVEINKIEGDNIIITDNQMQVTKENVLKNNKVCIISHLPDYNKCVRIIGTATYHESGKHFDEICNLETNKNWQPKGAIVITAKKIEEFS